MTQADLNPTHLHEIAAAVNRLTEAWAGCITDDQSTVMSAAGVWPLLGLIAMGADEPGREELAAAFGIDPAKADEAVRAFFDLIDGAPALRAALGLWHQAALPIHEAWLSRLPPAARGLLSGDAQADQAALDRWASEQTGGQIDAMPVKVDAGTVLVLASAISVETTWTTPFTDQASELAKGPWAGRWVSLLLRGARPQDIYLALTPGGPITVTRVEGEGDIDVYLLLGAEDSPAAAVLASGVAALRGEGERVPADQWVGENPAPGAYIMEISSHFPDPQTRITCVRFDIQADHNLLDNAEVFGLKTVSEPNFGHFSGISPAPLYVQQAAQSAMAKFTAEGFKAAAVTAMSMSVGSAMPTGKAKLTSVGYVRPFGFAAVHRPSGLIIAAGWVAEPEPAAAPTPYGWTY